MVEPLTLEVFKKMQYLGHSLVRDLAVLGVIVGLDDLAVLFQP